MAETPETGWDEERIIAEASAGIAAIEAAHGPAGPTCRVCPACAAYIRFVAQAIPVLARNMQKLEHDWIAQQSLLREQYDALREAHDTLMLEYADLETAHYLVRRELRRAQKDDVPEGN